MTAGGGRPRRRPARTLLRYVAPLVTGLAISVATDDVRAQGVRISGVTSMQYVELRPLVTDSALASLLPGTGEWRASPGGVPALCPVGGAYCTFERSGDRASAMPVLQDLTLAGWGLMEGLSVHANARLRTQAGAEGFAWPRGDDRFDLLDAYAELARDRWSGRLGRQWITGGLGVYNFDGAAATARRRSYSLEGWAGRALLGGLNEGYTSRELAAVENLPPDDDGLIFGVRARYRPDALTAASLLYQRVLVADRSGLYSERVAFDGAARRGVADATLALAYDMATGTWNEARLSVATAWLHPYGGSLEVRHSRPYFDLWTIWGAFAPVGFDEARATATWRAREHPFTASVRGAYRKYGDTEAGLDLRTNGWRAGADLSWMPGRALAAFASYDVDIGSGAANTDMRLGGRWSRDDGAMLGLDGSVTQNIYEFRVGTGRIYGLAVSGALPIRGDTRLVVDAGVYRHALSNGAPGPDWSQRRASIRFEWTVGRDPGLGGSR